MQKCEWMRAGFIVFRWTPIYIGMTESRKSNRELPPPAAHGGANGAKYMDVQEQPALPRCRKGGNTSGRDALRLQILFVRSLEVHQLAAFFYFDDTRSKAVDELTIVRDENQRAGIFFDADL